MTKYKLAAKIQNIFTPNTTIKPFDIAKDFSVSSVFVIQAFDLLIKRGFMIKYRDAMNTVYLFTGNNMWSI